MGAERHPNGAYSLVWGSVPLSVGIVRPDCSWISGIALYLRRGWIDGQRAQLKAYTNDHQWLKSGGERLV